MLIIHQYPSKVANHHISSASILPHYIFSIQYQLDNYKRSI